MKIVSGLGSLDEYIPFAEAGADEFFCGYVPFTWSKKYGTMQPLNRREVMNYNVQIGAFEELKILKKMVNILFFYQLLVNVKMKMEILFM